MDNIYQRAIELCNRLTEAFPSAGIGIAGSVGNGSARDDSDIDLLLVDNLFKRRATVTAWFDGQEYYIQCVNPSTSYEWLIKCSYHYAPELVHFVIDTRILRDKYGYLKTLQETALHVLDLKRNKDENYVQNFFNSKSPLVRQFIFDGKDNIYNFPKVTVDLFEDVVNGWFVKNGIVITKKESFYALEIIKAREPQVHALLEKIIAQME